MLSINLFWRDISEMSAEKFSQIRKLDNMMWKNAMRTKCQIPSDALPHATEVLKGINVLNLNIDIKRLNPPQEMNVFLRIKKLENKYLLHLKGVKTENDHQVIHTSDYLPKSIQSNWNISKHVFSCERRTQFQTDLQLLG